MAKSKKKAEAVEAKQPEPQQEAPKKEDEEAKMIAAACKAYGIDQRYVGGTYYNPTTKEAVIVTLGGAKVRFNAGDRPDPLDPVRVTGVNPKANKKKPILGKERA